MHILAIRVFKQFDPMFRMNKEEYDVFFISCLH